MVDFGKFNCVAVDQSAQRWWEGLLLQHLFHRVIFCIIVTDVSLFRRADQNPGCPGIEKFSASGISGVPMEWKLRMTNDGEDPSTLFLGPFSNQVDHLCLLHQL